ncbi:cyclase family protein [Pseudonocardia oroxyli]|nr:cyclase family protein [Pseudonocardia oroxyli]
MTRAGKDTMAEDNWGRWGDDDERGTLNLLTDDVVLEAARSCRSGKVYRLSLPLARTGVPLAAYRGGPQRLSLLTERDNLLGVAGVPDEDGACEDVLILPSHSVTHIDALCHAYHEGTFYNGFPASGFEPYGGATRLGVEKLSGFAGRGVLLDLAGFLGVSWLESDHVIAPGELADCARAQGVEIRAGDIVLLRTGWQDRFLAEVSRGDTPGHTQPGIGLEAARYLAERDIAALGADNSGIEPIPFPAGRPLAVHIEMLIRRGTPLIENMMLRELAADGCHEFLFVLGALPVPGATGSPVNPIAIA